MNPRCLDTETIPLSFRFDPPAARGSLTVRLALLTPAPITVDGKFAMAVACMETRYSLN